MRWSADPSLRRPAPGLVVGGSPLRLLRVSPGGDRLLDRLLAGGTGADAPVGGRLTAAEQHLVDRLVDAGALHPRPAPAEPGAPPSSEVTVVVPVRDRAEALDRLLLSVAEAGRADPACRPAAVVVVDDGSLDPAAHAAVAARHGARLVRRDRSGGPGVARDDGIWAVGTPLVAVVDSDCTVRAGWLPPLLGHLADPAVAAVAPRVRGRPGPGPLARYDTTRSPLDLGPVPGRVSPRTRVAYVPAAALLLRVSAHRSVGGFDPALRCGEDVDLVWRLAAAGHRVRYEPGVVVLHDVRPGAAAWLRQRVGYGRSAAALDRRHPGAVAPVTCSPWSAAGWALVATGHPVAGSAVLAASAAALPRRLPGLPPREAARLAVSGHLGAGALLARAVVRAWWPPALVVSLRSRRARRALAVAAAATVVGARRSRPPGMGPAQFAALVLADDVAYGAGVWWGCAEERSVGPLLADLRHGPRRGDAGDRAAGPTPP